MGGTRIRVQEELSASRRCCFLREAPYAVHFARFLIFFGWCMGCHCKKLAAASAMVECDRFRLDGFLIASCLFCGGQQVEVCAPLNVVETECHYHTPRSD